MKQVTIEQFPEILAFADRIFFSGCAYGFKEVQPKIYKHPEVFAEKHFLFEVDDQPVGLFAVYPTEYLGLKLLGIGTVGVAEEYRNRGIMSAMFSFIKKHLEPQYDLLYLSGNKFRYENFGYYKTGRLLMLNFTSRAFKELQERDYRFQKYLDADLQTNALLYEMYKQKKKGPARNPAFYDDYLRTHGAEIYLLKDGYLVYNPYQNTIVEIIAPKEEELSVIHAFLKYKELANVLYALSFDHPNLLPLREKAADYRITELLNFRIVNYPKVIETLFSSKKQLRKGTLILRLNAHSYRISIEDNIRVEKVPDYEAYDLQLNEKEFHSLLFENYPDYYDDALPKADLIKSWFPVALPATLASIDSI
jgi:predicted acetyltransferase